MLETHISHDEGDPHRLIWDAGEERMERQIHWAQNSITSPSEFH